MKSRMRRTSREGPIIVLELTGHTSTKQGGLEDHWTRLARRGVPDAKFVILENSSKEIPSGVRSLLTDAGIVIEPCELSGQSWFGLLRQLVLVFRHCRPDVVHVHFSPVAYLGIAAARLTGVPVVVWTIHSRVGIRRQSASWLRHSIAMRWVDRVICVSEAVCSDLSALGLGLGKLQIVPLGVDLERFGNDNLVQRATARLKLGLNPDDIVITMVSQARPEKNTDLLLRAAAQLTVEPWFEHSVFLLVGGGPGEDDSRRLARELGLCAHVRFLGIRQDVPLIYAASDIAGLTSRTEGLPCPLLEAGASGLPVFGSKIGGIPEVIEDGSNGLLFESGNAMGLAHALDRLARDRNLREFMGQGGARARDLYALDSRVDRLLAVYKELLR